MLRASGNVEFMAILCAKFMLILLCNGEDYEQMKNLMLELSLKVEFGSKDLFKDFM